VLINTNIQQLYLLLPQEYAGGVLVVFMISLLKLFNGFMGNNGAIINNSEFYRIMLPISVCMALSVYFLNKLFYYELEMGTDGLALATLMVIFSANSFKLYFVKRKFSMIPYTKKTLMMIFIIASLYLLFNFWDFSIEEIYISKFPVHPIVNMFLKSTCITIVYLFLIFRLNISSEFSNLIKRYF
jgi:hypothetical protein